MLPRKSSLKDQKSFTFGKQLSMKKGYTIVLLFLCFGIKSKAQNPQFTIVHDGLVRSYILHVPPSFTATDTLPLVFCLHGLNQTAGRIAQVSGFDTIADRERFIVVYPTGVDTIWNTFSNPYHSGADDAGFISALIDTLYRDYHINLNRVYATGMSNGGFMSYKLACELSERIAAIAPLSGALTDSMRYYSHPSRPMPVLHIHGTSDFLVGYNGGLVNISVANTLLYWREYNNCPLTEVVTQLPNTNTQDNSTVTKYEWLPCDNQSEVIHYKVNSGGHTWPGSSVTFGGLGGNTNYDVNASEVIWEFFNRFTLEGRIATGLEELPRENIQIYPNPFHGQLTVSTDQRIQRIQVSDVFGNVLIESISSDKNCIEISLEQARAGLYLLELVTPTERITRKLVKVD
jgi:polyhydroxybutyrate depolymerase